MTTRRATGTSSSTSRRSAATSAAWHSCLCTTHSNQCKGILTPCESSTELKSQKNLVEAVLRQNRAFYSERQSSSLQAELTQSFLAPEGATPHELLTQLVELSDLRYFDLDLLQVHATAFEDVQHAQILPRVGHEPVAEQDEPVADQDEVKEVEVAVFSKEQVRECTRLDTRTYHGARH